MYDLQYPESIIYYMFYAAVTVMFMIASCYLMLRRGNAFAPDIISPVRLRRRTATFFAAVALGHLWYLPIVFLTSHDDVMLCGLIGALLDCAIVIPLSIVVLFAMLQDRRRPMWLVAVMCAPPVVGMVWVVATRSSDLLPMIRVYYLLLGIGLLIYMVRELRQYGRWLRDNYADLEHKEVWQTFIVLAVFLLLFGFYVSYIGGIVYEYIVQLNDVLLLCYLLWRVETLSDLSSIQSPSFSADEDPVDRESLASVAFSEKDMGSLLQLHCIDEQLYLQHDLTLQQLAKAVGTNRLYLGQYFSSQGTNYNAYINDLRIDHFVNLYREAMAAQQPFTAQQLARNSGYRSYSTFSLAFKQRMGQTVTAWMRETDNGG
jgi:AraC-like DNA-binding protein